MTRTHLVVVNEGHNLQSGLTYACETFPEDHIVALFVDTGSDGPGSVRWDEVDDPTAEWMAGNRAAAEEAFEAARDVAGDHGVDLETVVAFGNINQAIQQYCAENDVDTVVVGVEDRDAFSSYVVV